MEKGVSLYLTIVILAVLTAALLVLVGISISQIKVIFTLGDSTLAFYAADTGIEKILYDIYKTDYSPQATGECPYPAWQSLGEGEYKVCVSDTSTSTIWSTGKYKNTQRRIEINF